MSAQPIRPSFLAVESTHTSLATAAVRVLMSSTQPHVYKHTDTASRVCPDVLNLKSAINWKLRDRQSETKPKNHPRRSQESWKERALSEETEGQQENLQLAGHFACSWRRYGRSRLRVDDKKCSMCASSRATEFQVVQQLTLLFAQHCSLQQHKLQTNAYKHTNGK